MILRFQSTEKIPEGLAVTEDPFLSTITKEHVASKPIPWTCSFSMPESDNTFYIIKRRIDLMIHPSPLFIHLSLFNFKTQKMKQNETIMVIFP